MANTWVRKAGEKSTRFNMHRDKETIMEVNKSFMDPRALTSKTQMQLVQQKNSLQVVTVTKNPDLTILKSFLHTCM